MGRRSNVSAKSNSKGSAFERLVCRRLTELVTGSPTPEIFWRSATSGAKATVDRAAGRESNMGGDIVAIDPKGQPFLNKFSVECKDRASFGKMDSLIQGKGELLAWWRQCAEDAKASRRYPLMIFKALRTQVYVAWLVGTAFTPRGGRYIVFRCPVYNEDVSVGLFEEWIEMNDWNPKNTVSLRANGEWVKPRPKKVGI